MRSCRGSRQIRGALLNPAAKSGVGQPLPFGEIRPAQTAPVEYDQQRSALLAIERAAPERITGDFDRQNFKRTGGVGCFYPPTLS
jgi:hypothetical protein